MAEDTMEIRIVGDWSQFDEEAKRREAQGRSMTFAGERFGTPTVRTLSPQQVALENQIAAADRQISSYRPLQSLGDINSQFRQLGLGTVSADPFFNSDRLFTRANRIGQEMAGLFNQFPALQNAALQQPLAQISFARDLGRTGEGPIGGYYQASSRLIRMADLERQSEQDPNSPFFYDPELNFRHEYGHHLHRQGSMRQMGIESQLRRYYRGNRKDVASFVGEYGASSFPEFAAEAFAQFTMPEPEYGGYGPMPDDLRGIFNAGLTGSRSFVPHLAAVGGPLARMGGPGVLIGGEGRGGGLGPSEPAESSLARLSQAAGDATAALQRLTGAGGGSVGGGGGGFLPPPGAFGGEPPDRRLARTNPRAYSSGGLSGFGSGGSGDGGRLPPEYIDIPNAPGQQLLTGPAGPPANYSQWFGGPRRMPGQTINIPGAGGPPPPPPGTGLAGFGGGPAGGGPGMTVPGGYGGYRGYRTGGPPPGVRQSIWTRNLGGQGLYYATIFGAFEVARAVRGTEEAEWQYAIANTDAERLRARLAGIDAATSGVLGGVVELGLDAFGAASGFTSISPTAVRREIRNELFRTESFERIRQTTVGLEGRARIRAVALLDPITQTEVAQQVATDAERSRLRQEIAGHRQTVLNLMQDERIYETSGGGYNEAGVAGTFRSTGRKIHTPASLAALREQQLLEAQLKEQDDIDASNAALIARQRGLRQAGITNQMVQAGAFRALRLGVEDPRGIERSVRQSEMNLEVSQMYARGSTPQEIQAVRVRQDAELGLFDEQTRRQKQQREIEFRSNLVGSAYGAQGNDIMQQFTQLQSNVRQAIAGADSFVEKIRLGLEGAAAIFEFKSRTNRLVSGTVQDLGAETEAMGMALARDPLQARLRGIRAQTAADLRSPLAIFSSDVRKGIIARGEMQEELARQQFQDETARLDQQLVTSDRILRARENRSPASGRLARVEGGIESDVLALQQAGFFAQATRRAQIGEREINQFEKEYLEGFRGVQVDPRMVRITNRRDLANPEQVLKDIQEARERVGAIRAGAQDQEKQAEVRRQQEEAKMKEEQAKQQPVVKSIADLQAALPAIIQGAVRALIPG